MSEEMNEQVQSGYQQSNIDKEKSQFLPLPELVYAPLDAIVQSNLQLAASAIDQIRSMGTSKIEHGKEIIYLKNLNLAYERLHPERDDNAYVENVEVQVPLMSIVPVPNLKVKSATVNFAAELLVVEDEAGDMITGKICAPVQRGTDDSPRVDYRIKLTSVEETEGYMRILDALNANPVTKPIKSEPVKVQTEGGEKEIERFHKKHILKKQEATLHRLYSEITEFIETMDNMESSGVVKHTDFVSYDKQHYEKMKQNIVSEILKIKETMLTDKVEVLKEGGVQLA